MVDGLKGHKKWYSIATTQDDVMINISYINDALESVILVDDVKN